MVRAVVFVEGRDCCVGYHWSASCDHLVTTTHSQTMAPIDGKRWHRLAFSTTLRCDECGIDYPEPEPQLFNFNRPLGACPECEGFGNIVVDRHGSRCARSAASRFADGAIAPWNAPSYAHELEELLALADDYKLPRRCTIFGTHRGSAATHCRRRAGTKFRRPERILPLARTAQVQNASACVFEPLAIVLPCPACGGARLRPEALAVRVGGKNFADVCRLKIRDAAPFFDELQLARLAAANRAAARCRRAVAA